MVNLKPVACSESGACRTLTVELLGYFSVKIQNEFAFVIL